MCTSCNDSVGKLWYYQEIMILITCNGLWIIQDWILNNFIVVLWIMPVKLDYTWLIVYFVKFDGDTIAEAVLRSAEVSIPDTFIEIYKSIGRICESAINSTKFHIAALPSRRVWTVINPLTRRIQNADNYRGRMINNSQLVD